MNPGPLDSKTVDRSAQYWNSTCKPEAQLATAEIARVSGQNYTKLEIRSVERGICPVATSTINERTVPIIMAGCMAHEGEGYISTSGLKSDVTIVFLDPDFL